MKIDIDITAEPTRKQYMDPNHPCTHAEYYRAVAHTAGVTLKHASPEFLARVRGALNAGDEHLNGIPLSVWDIKAAGILSLHSAFKKHGDFHSLAGACCLVKQMAIDAAS